jgi:hypothetical protein
MTPFMKHKFAVLDLATAVGGAPAVNFAAAADTVYITPATPIKIVRWGLVVTSLLDVGAGFIAALDFRPTAGSDTDRVNGSVAAGVDTAGGTITTTADVAAGAGLYHELSTPLEILPGEQGVIQITDAADTAGTGLFWVEYEEEPFAAAYAGSDSRLVNMTEATS